MLGLVRHGLLCNANKYINLKVSVAVSNHCPNFIQPKILRPGAIGASAVHGDENENESLPRLEQDLKSSLSWQTFRNTHRDTNQPRHIHLPAHQRKSGLSPMLRTQASSDSEMRAWKTLAVQPSSNCGKPRAWPPTKKTLPECLELCQTRP